jgi:hypothetical protein
MVVAPPTADGSEITLIRKTYSLKEDQAKALADFLKTFAKAKVLEMQTDGGKLTVTTTPGVQATVGQVVALMLGQTNEPGPHFLFVPQAPEASGWKVSPPPPGHQEQHRVIVAPRIEVEARPVPPIQPHEPKVPKAAPSTEKPKGQKDVTEKQEKSKEDRGQKESIRKKEDEGEEKKQDKKQHNKQDERKSDESNRKKEKKVRDDD